MFSYLLLHLVSVYIYIDSGYMFIYICCFVSCQWYLPVIKNSSDKAMKEKRFNKSSTISIDIALGKNLIGNDNNNREKNQCYLHDGPFRKSSIITSTINFYSG